VRGGDADLGAEDGFGQGDRQVQRDVVAVAAVERVGADVDFDQGIAGRRPFATGRAALAFQAQDLAFVDAGGDLDLDGLAVRQRQLAGGADDGVEEIDVEAVAAILAARVALGPSAERIGTSGLAAGAEVVGEDVAEIRSVGRAVAASGGAFGVAGIALLGAAFLALVVDLAGVVAGALGGVGQQFIGGRDCLEPLLGRLVAGVEVGVIGFRQLAIGALDRGRIGIPADTQGLVKIHRDSSLPHRPLRPYSRYGVTHRPIRQANYPQCTQRRTMFRIWNIC